MCSHHSKDGSRFLHSSTSASSFQPAHVWSVCAVQPSERMEFRRMRTLPACCSAPHALHTNPHSLSCTHSSKEDGRRIMRLARRPELVTNHIKRFSPSCTAKGMVYILGSLPCGFLKHGFLKHGLKHMSRTATAHGFGAPDHAGSPADAGVCFCC